MVIIKKLMSLNKEFKKVFKIKPKIGVLGLNPHNAELNKKSEEVKSNFLNKTPPSPSASP